MRKWKVAVAGCGHLTENVYLPQMRQLSGVFPAAVCDVNFERAQAVAAKFGIPAVYGSAEQMIEECGFDILMDIASIQSHHAINMTALRAGRHVYSQKPFAATTAQATEQIEAARKANVKLSAAPVHMIRPEIKAVKRMLDAGIIGKPALMQISLSHGGPEYFQYRDSDPSWFYRPGAGALLDMGVHALHQITGLMGPAKAVSCMAAVSQPVRQARSGAVDGIYIKADQLPDNYIISLDFGNGRLGMVDTGYIQKATKNDLGSFDIYGAKGTIHVGGGVSYTGVADVDVYIDSDDLGLRGWLRPMPWKDDPAKFFQCMCLTDLILAIELNQSPALSAEHARHVVEIMEAIPLAVEQRRAIDLSTEF